MNLLELNNLTLYKGDFQFDLTTFKKSFIHVHTFRLYITLEEKGSNTKDQTLGITPFSITK